MWIGELAKSDPGKTLDGDPDAGLLAVSATFLMPLLERRIFTRPGSAPNAGA